MHAQVVLTNLRVDVPRCSWSPEMYTLSCAQARLLLPVAEEQVANMMPDMSRCASFLEDHHRMHCCVKRLHQSKTSAKQQQLKARAGFLS